MPTATAASVKMPLLSTVHSAGDIESVFSKLNANLDDDVDSGRAADDKFTIQPRLAAINLDGTAAAVAPSSPSGSPSSTLPVPPISSIHVHDKEHPVAVDDYSFFGGPSNC